MCVFFWAPSSVSRSSAFDVEARIPYMSYCQYDGRAISRDMALSKSFI